MDYQMLATNICENILRTLVLYGIKINLLHYMQGRLWQFGGLVIILTIFHLKIIEKKSNTTYKDKQISCS